MNWWGNTMARYIYPQNLRATASIWLWRLRDFTVMSVALLAAVALAELRLLFPAAAVLCYGFLTIRVGDETVLDFIRYALRCFITAQQYYEWR